MNTQDKIIYFLYETRPGRMLLPVLVKPGVSKFAGMLLDRPVSKLLIPGFIRRNHIDMTQYEQKVYTSYNDFFTRKVAEGRRPVDPNPDTLIAPCDAKLSAYRITEDLKVTVKQTEYTLPQLFKSRKLAAHYKNGILLLFRLTVDDYHRYCYMDNGKKSGNHYIQGVFHTVNPTANDCRPIYKENTRAYTLLKSENFGTMAVMEVGALLVGRIVNHHEAAVVSRGEEKGMFEFGGSTIIVCLEADRAELFPEIWENSEMYKETVVQLGAAIGFRKGGHRNEL